MQLDFDGAMELDCTRQAEHRWTLRSDDLLFNVPLKGADDEKWIGAASPGVGSRGALAFHVDPTPHDPHAMDKIMVELFGLHGSRDDFVRFGQAWFVSFRLMLAADFEAPQRDTRMLVWQLWQGSPYPPPLRLEIDHERRVVLYLMNDRTGTHVCANEPSCPNLSPEYEGVRTLYRSEPMALGEWTPFVIRVVPRHEAMEGGRLGEIELWIGDLHRDHAVHRSEAFVGYDPAGFGRYPRPEERGSRHPLHVFDSSIGIYRTRQPRSQTVMFDHLRAGSTFEAVAHD